MNLFRLLQARHAANKPVRVALIGAGKFGSMFLAQVPHVSGLEVPVIVDLDPQRASEACKTVGWDEARIEATTFTADAAKATSDNIEVIVEATVTRLVQQGGIVAPTGKPGGMLMFHGNLVHGSSGNITPYPRKIVYLTLNAVSNYIRTPTRPEYIAHRDFTAIRPVAHDALKQLARSTRQAAE